MSKFVYFNDPHIHDTPITTRSDDSTEALLRKFDYLISYCENHGVKQAVCGGDFLDTPDVSNGMARKVAKKFDRANKKFGLKLVVIIGNHDVYGKNLATYVDSKLGMFELYSWFTILHDGKSKNFKDFILVGENYSKERECAFRYEFDAKVVQTKATKADDGVSSGRIGAPKPLAPVVMVAHPMISGDERSMRIGKRVKIVSYKDVELTGIDLLLCGHFHPGFGVKESKTLEFKSMIANPGSLLRTAKGIEDAGFSPGFFVVTISGDAPIPVDRIKIKHVRIPHEDVFSDAEECPTNSGSLSMDFSKLAGAMSGSECSVEEFAVMVRAIFKENPGAFNFKLTKGLIKFCEKIWLRAKENGNGKKRA